ncbi:tannase/feruloyl esterase family alpha/beta hydrolase [Variovorax sp. J22G21]|uniref:tannase/feruloyl esterase family alpha/beta hydrolase n=1 Tax=Variovorax fucosicus TaxID=3053517 RepID=UPI002577C113|nr:MULTISPECIES: tannase/feruloyl esterase family alpha/beta hydrolase [unclassified Variovorax]MDM0041215.1 tannase/feruloyl esterase family alpha/beta hydrolase [Variovorax sp. J22R193]MDM0060272.1 tannase/feruloyl esterase family alpha/beta hydrolase [Variovorax sp. J22G21]
MKFQTLCVLFAGALLLPACGTVATPPSKPLACDDGLKSAFKPDALTTVVAVRNIRKGTPLVAVDSPQPITAATDMCLVKLLVGPGATAEKDTTARSWSQGIGIEVWLPAPAVWNERIRNYGGGGWVGGGHRYPEPIGSKVPAIVNANMGYASGTHDGGQPHYQDASFAFLSNGRVNEESFRDMSSRAIYEQAIKTRALVEVYYGRTPRYSYYDGHSQGGRQGLKVAQERPDLYDGYLIAQPAVSVTRFSLAGLYPQIVMKEELGITALDRPAADAFARKVAAANARAVANCDKEKLGFLVDPFSCSYDPLRDAGALCTGVTGQGVTGSNADAATCMSAKEAVALNKIWYGPTRDGSYDPAQTTDGRAGRVLGSKQLWWAPTRGSSLSTQITSVAGSDTLALAMQDVAYAAAAPAASGIPITNTSTTVRNRWRELTLPGYAEAFLRIDTLPFLRDYLTDNADLGRFRSGNRKMILWNGLAEDVIPAQGAVHWYERVKASAGGEAQVQQFLRMYNIPGMAHSSQGRAFTVAGNNNVVPMPWLPGNANQTPTRDRDLMFSALVDWVERGVAPGEMVISSRDNSVSYPICVYPKRITWKGTGTAKAAADYECR